MASERQTAANRRNAQRSTGPRSTAGKRRASQNSFRHGFSAKRRTSTETEKQIEKLAREIAGSEADEPLLRSARSAAEAEFDLAQIRRIKVALIARMSAFGSFEGPKFPTGLRDILEILQARAFSGTLPQPPDPAATMPVAESERSAEAIRRVIPELLALNRYERRAAVKRDRSLRQVLARLS
jgi:hypothetical protein